MKRRREFKPYCSILRAALLSGRIRMERERDMPNGLDFKSLKDKQQKLRDGFPDNVSLRIHRSLSWIERAGTCAGDDDAAILFYWIAFNAAYAVDAGKRDWSREEEQQKGERDKYDEFFGKILKVDSKRAHKALSKELSKPVKGLLDNKYIYAEFWHSRNSSGSAHWESSFNKDKEDAHEALAKGEKTRKALNILFDRLNVLRNQIVHGSATWKSSVNRDQVENGAHVMAVLVPLFVDLMMDKPHESLWGKPYFPVVEE